MSGLAKLLAQCGHSVSGSDLKPAPALASLAALGVETWVGHRPRGASAWDLLVSSSAVPEKDPEVAAARRAGIEVWERPRLLQAITERMPALGITGTHGKTSGTALAIAALRGLGRDPTFVVGGQLIDLNTNAHLGEDGLFVLEADEAFGTFQGLSLRGLVITNVEADHLDHYGTLEALEAAFAEVAEGVDGPVVYCVDDPGAVRVAAGVDDAIGYGTGGAATWRIQGIDHSSGAVSFDLGHQGVHTPVRIARPGIHIARNAGGVLALIGQLGLDVAGAAAAFADFGGVRRRFEIKARRGGVTVVDDYAHHPTEIAATVDAARLGHEGRVLAAFQPHRFTRTEEHAVEFGGALAAADRVYVTDVYAAGEAPIPGVTGRLVADAVEGGAAYIPRRADLAGVIAEEAEPGDMVLLLGAGDIGMVATELAPLLGSDR